VDSEKEHCLVLASLLKEEGHQVTSCSDSVEALETFQKENFSFVIVDHLPPILDGLGLLEQMKLQKTQTPILLISSQYEMEPYIIAMNLGALDYLDRPLDYLEVQRLIKTHSK
jgi:DNA-binding response OmpR family regulator